MNIMNYHKVKKAIKSKEDVYLVPTLEADFGTKGEIKVLNKAIAVQRGHASKFNRNPAKQIHISGGLFHHEKVRAGSPQYGDLSLACDLGEIFCKSVEAALFKGGKPRQTAANIHLHSSEWAWAINAGLVHVEGGIVRATSKLKRVYNYRKMIEAGKVLVSEQLESVLGQIEHKKEEAKNGEYTVINS